MKSCGNISLNKTELGYIDYLIELYDCMILHSESICEMTIRFLEQRPTDHSDPSFALPFSRSASGLAVCLNLQLTIFQAISCSQFMMEHGSMEHGPIDLPICSLLDPG